MLIFVGNGIVGFGVVIRNGEVEILLAASHHVRASWEVNVAETKAVLYALELSLWWR